MDPGGKKGSERRIEGPVLPRSKRSLEVRQPHANSLLRVVHELEPLLTGHPHTTRGGSIGIDLDHRHRPLGVQTDASRGLRGVRRLQHG